MVLAGLAVLSLPFPDGSAMSPHQVVILSPPVLELPHPQGSSAISSGQQVVITINVTHNFGDKDEDLIVLIEVRDEDGVTEYLAWQSGQVQVGDRMEIGVSWIPTHGGFYELRTFAITNDWENPQVLSVVVTSKVEIRHSCKGSAACITGQVTKIVDGDTLDIGGTRIRLALVNTPEMGVLAYGAAKTFTTEMCPVDSEAVVDEDDGQTEGSFGRMVAVVYCGMGGHSLNEALLNAELADILLEFCGTSEFADERWARVYGCSTFGDASAAVECLQSSLCTYRLQKGNTTYSINFRLDGTVEKMISDSTSLSIQLAVEEQTSLLIAVPREVLDSREGEDGTSGADTEFVAFVDNIGVNIVEFSTEEAGLAEALGIIANPEKYRILEISIPEGSERVDIVRTWLL